MRVLAIETSGQHGGIALGEFDETLVESRFGSARVQCRDLVPLIDGALARLGWRPADLELVCVSRGPGSYTGIRVGVAAAKSLAFFGGIPLVGVDTLDALVHDLGPGVEPASPVSDAHRDQVYWAPFDWSEGRPRRTGPDRVTGPSEAAAGLPSSHRLFGSGARRYRDLFLASGLVVDETLGVEPSPAAVLRVGMRFHDLACRGEHDDGAHTLAIGRAVHAFAPLYLRLPDAVERALSS